MCEDTIWFYGVIDIDEEVYYVRFADDWLDMVEIGDSSSEIHEKDYVSFSVKYENIGIYPYESLCYYARQDIDNKNAARKEN